MQSLDISLCLFLDALFYGTVNIPPELYDIWRCIPPVRHDLLDLIIRQSHFLCTHCFHRTYGAAIATGELGYFTLLSQMPINAVFHNGNSEYL